MKNDSPPNKLLMGLTSVAEMLDISKETIRFWVRGGAFPRPTRIGKRIYWRRETIESWVEDQFAPKAVRGRPRNTREYI